MLWSELLKETEQIFKDSGVSDAEISARLIVEEASGFHGAEWVDCVTQEVTERAVAKVDKMAGRRCAGEPLQYVLGSWDFRHISVMVDKRVLIPRPETEVVVEHALSEVSRVSEISGESKIVKVADLGTGSGVIGLSIAAEYQAAEVLLSDASADALVVARQTW